jgi:hypothetical protein
MYRWMYDWPLPYSIGDSMCSRIQFTGSGPARFCITSRKLSVILLGVFLLWPAWIHAQGTPSGLVGRIEGNDVSVQGASAPGSDNETITRSILVGNGSVVTVHSGQARMTLISGGEVDICGPAKFTLLQSGGAITVALDFGRMRVQLPATASLRVFTPTIIATPLDISGGARDVTVGLDLNDSLCVLATSGAIQMEHQFSGEKLIVPQTGEFFLNAGKLLPVVGKPGSCQCAAMEMPAAPASREIPEFAMNAQPLPELAKSQPSPAAASAMPTPPPGVELSILAHANEGHPVAPAEKNAAPAAAPAEAPVYTVVAPPLAFTAGSPMPPPEPPVDTILLVREAQVEPAWEFKGHVDAPNFATALQHALGETSASSQPVAEPQKKHRGFWATLRRLF